MEKNELINENLFFVESKKALQIVIEREQLLGKKMRSADKLELVKQHKKATTNPVTYDELEKQEKELERKIKFHQLNEPAVPEEYREIVKRNVELEQNEVDKLLNQLKAQLRFQYKYLEDEVLPLLLNIQKLEGLGVIPVQIDILLDGEIGEETPFKIENLIKQQNYSAPARRANETIQNLRKVIKTMKKLEYPTNVEKLSDQLKEGAK